jgi:4-hydroxy-3-polyprenylbenzoate decarboxylase
VYPATIVGIPPQEDAWIGKATERIFLAPIKMTMVPEIVDMVLPMEGVFHNLVIVKIKKDYPGQAIKVMNSLWGAGQMMFTKMMIVVDGDVNIHDNLEVARYISENVDPQSDIIYTSGPMDVLDHSCSKAAFGGKMGIDATRKLPEEMRSSENVKMNLSPIADKQKIYSEYPEIKDINDELLKLGVSLVVVSVEKNRKGHIKVLNEQLFAREEFKHVKVIIFLEHTIDISDLADAVWRFSNNVDPKRDAFSIEAEDENSISHVGFDGTRKTKELDGFQRDWPNILANTPEVIEKVDAMWDKLGLGPFVESPSRKYIKQLYEGGAVAK